MLPLVFAVFLIASSTKPASQKLWFWEAPGNPSAPVSNPAVSSRLANLRDVLAFESASVVLDTLADPWNLKAARMYLPHELHRRVEDELGKGNYQDAWNLLPTLGETLPEDEGTSIRQYIRQLVINNGKYDFLFRAGVMQFQHPEIITVVARRVASNKNAFFVRMEGLIDENGVARRTPQMQLLIVTKNPPGVTKNETFHLTVAATLLRAEFTERVQEREELNFARVFELVDSQPCDLSPEFLAMSSELVPELPEGK